MTADENGRFPTDIILSYDNETYEEVCGGFPTTKSTGGSGEASRTSTTQLYSGGWNPDKICAHLGGLGDEGSAARYFYCAKASVRDREEGIDGKEEEVRVTNQYEMPRENGTIRNVQKKKNNHPSVKPVDLMCYLVRLIPPNGGTILDPFNGSGSTGKATMYENNDHNKGYKYIGIELDEHYCDISRARIEYAESDCTKITEVGSDTKSNPVTKVVGIKAKKFFEI
jgi:site-specific DNA-methyltransferase (adenine-specific)